MAFRALYSSAVKFKYIVQSLAKIVDEIPFIAVPDGIETYVLTPDKTTMVVLKLPVTAFEEYEVEDKETFVVSSDEINRVAKRGARNDLVELKLDRDNRRLEVNFMDKKTSVVRSFYVTLRESVVEELVEPQVELTVSMKLESKILKDIIGDAKIVSDEIEFIAYEDRVEVIASAQPKTYKAVLREGEPLIGYNVSGSVPIKSKYSIDLLKATFKAVSSAKTVSVEYGESLPMKIIFDLPGGGILTYWISPRV